MHTRLLGLGVLSAAALFVEIGLTRFLSTLYYPPFVFVVLSLAVLGIGLGAGLAAALRSLRQDRFVATYAAFAALTTLGTLLAAILFPDGPLRFLLFALLVLPFLCTGLALSTLFSHAAADSPRLYLADLGGAGLGALLVVPTVNAIGLLNGLLLAAFSFAIAAVLLSPHRTAPLPWIAAALAVVFLIGNASTGWLALDVTDLPTDKPVAERLQNGGNVLRTVWDAFARTDLVDPGDGTPYQIYMDGAAGSVMPPAAETDALIGDIGFFPFATEQPARVFVIGPGGGLDVWFGLRSGAEAITAVEVNPASVDLVREFAAYNGDLYNQPNVRVLVDEGRSVLQREARTYDLIFLSQVMTLAAERSGYALVENSAYTVEAFETYLDHLRGDGQIALKLYDEPTLTRALSTALAAFARRGLTDAEALQHVIALLDPSAEPPIPLLMVRKTPYSRDDALSIGAVARQVGFTPLFLPHVWAQPPLDAVAAGERPFAEVLADAESDLSPTTDDRPFFFQFERGLPGTLRPLLWGMLGAILTGGLFVARTQRRGHPGTRWFPLYFAAVGLGFMLAEVAVIQQTRLFLGHPTIAVTTVLATLLIGGGIGSGLAGRWSQGALPIWPPLGVATWLAIWILFWPWLSGVFSAAPLPLRIVVTIVSLLPLALSLGMPFPLGLRSIGRLGGGGQVALAWTVNGVMSVAGAVTAVALALVTGYSSVLIAALAAYLLATLCVPMIGSSLTEGGEKGYERRG